MHSTEHTSCPLVQPNSNIFNKIGSERKMAHHTCESTWKQIPGAALEHRKGSLLQALAPANPTTPPIPTKRYTLLYTLALFSVSHRFGFRTTVNISTNLRLSVVTVLSLQGSHKPFLYRPQIKGQWNQDEIKPGFAPWRPKYQSI